MRLADRPRRAPIRYRDTGSFLLWYIFGVIVVVLGEAVIISDIERSACAGVACSGHPVTFRLAVQWLAQRLLLNDPPGLTPLTGRAWAVGRLASVMALAGVGVLITAVRQHVKYRGVIMNAVNLTIEEAHRRTVVLILVATDVERFAVVEAAKRANGGEATRRFVPRQVVFELGLIGWIVVKAISDWAHRKTKKAQPKAAANVAEFVVSVIRSGALDEREVPANLR
ncbi:hypothetical protein AB0H83_14945 [Dactylosporangium sp. NPDC050688]|uniref:hypothetical protein n=1 Tax=Dactylosporangium sp. NPDC050688 TaxID=3157217 RepID=UPI0033D44495